MSAPSSNMLAAQGALNGMADKFGGRTPVRVHFLDNSSKMFLLDEDTLAKDLIQTILDKFSVTESLHVSDYFAIYDSLDGHNIGLSLNPEDKVVSHVKGWSTGDGNGKASESAKLVFMIRLFMPCLWGITHKDEVAQLMNKPVSAISVELYLESAATRDEALIHLQYIQALYHIITSQYPTTEEQALTLGAYHFIFKFGNYKPDVHKLGFLGTRIVEFVPIKLLRLHDFDEWETKLLEHLKDFTAHDRHEKTVQRLYMEDVFKMTIYGSSFFRCNQKGAHNLPENIILGVQHDGIKLFDKNRNLLLSFRIEEVLRWGFKPGVMFYFEVHPTPDMDGTLEFDSADGKIISDLLTDYALAFIQEKMREDERKLGDPSSTTESNLPEPPAIVVSASSPSDSHDKPTTEDEDESDDHNSSDTHSSVDHDANEQEKSVSIDEDSHHEDHSQDDHHSVDHSVDGDNDAAVAIQSRFRGFSIRNEMNKHDAAILIQSTFRGHKGRVEVSEMIEKMLSEGGYGEEED